MCGLCERAHTPCDTGRQSESIHWIARNGHRIELNTAIIATTVSEGANEVELGLGQVSLVLGDFDVPTECLGPTLVGFVASFPVGPPA